jgi:histidinol phosphatase-like PHP family hydrolase
MIIKSDWHIHSEFSYDGNIKLEDLKKQAIEQNLEFVGVTDHLNFNDEKFVGDVTMSAKAVLEMQKSFPKMVLGVELTPIAKPEFDYIARTKTRDGFVEPKTDVPYEIELALTKDELKNLGVRYAVGGAHWRVDVPKEEQVNGDLKADVKEWHRQQIWLACDERVTILAHPWYHGYGIWYEDFSVIPKAMNDELISTLKSNGKFIECNTGVLLSPLTTERFRRQYCEFLREAFEKGVPVTYGSDAHGEYTDRRAEVEAYLKLAGFKDGDLACLTEDNLW